MPKCEICEAPLRPARTGEAIKRCPSTWTERPGQKPLRVYSSCERLAMTLSTLRALVFAVTNPLVARNIAKALNRLRMQIVRRFEGGAGQSPEL